MSILGDLFSSGASSLVSSVGSAIDSLVTSDEERLTLKNELKKIDAEYRLKFKELENKAEAEITKRQSIDMASDSWLSKNIRPMSFIFMLAMTTLFTFTDGNFRAFTVKLGWVELWTTLTVAFAVFYAGGRSLEKFKSISVKKQSTDAYED